MLELNVSKTKKSSKGLALMVTLAAAFLVVYGLDMVLSFVEGFLGKEQS